MASEEEVTVPVVITEKSDENAAGSQGSTWVDPKDGTIYEWDSLQRGWFPQINDDLIATYTTNYRSSETAVIAQANVLSGEGDTGREERVGESVEVKESGRDLDIEVPAKKKKNNDTPSWFEVEDNQNKHVYVTNLPSTTTEEQFVELMRKCGVIAQHEDGRPKVKLYRTEEGEQKGDGLCTYLRVESVDYAQLILDGSEFEGHVLKVEPAVFEMKGQYNAALKPKKKKKKKNRAEKLVKWKEPFYDRPKHERVVIMKNLFTPAELTENPLLSVQVRDQIKSECEKHGKVKKAIVCETHSEGVVSVMFVEHSGADECVRVMQGREFAGRVIGASLWDGETDYVQDESEESREKRLQEWKEYLQK